jgi:hypothetical protein
MPRFLWNIVYHDSWFDNSVPNADKMLQLCGVFYESEESSRMFAESVSADINFITFEAWLTLYKLMPIKITYKISIPAPHATGSILIRNVIK